METALDKAIEIAGGLKALADLIDQSPQAVSNWRSRRRVPAARCLDIETALNRQVTCADLRPDIFGYPTRRTA